VLVAAIVLSAAIGTWLARLTTRPLTELSGAAARVAEGDLDTEIDVPGGDEVGKLAAAFNEVTRELRGYVGEVETSRDRLQDSYGRLGDTLMATHDLTRILGVVLETAVDTVGASAGAAYVMLPDRDGLQLRASHGLDGRDAGRRLQLGNGIVGAVAANGQPLAGRVGTGDLVPAPGEPTARDVMAVPLRTGSSVLGVVSLYDRKDGRAFDNGDLETIKTFAGQAAVALDNVLLHQEAQQLSITDALTGLGNFRSFQHSLAREVDRAARFERTLGLLIIDLDRFKSVNDLHGHQVGNDVLVEVAERLRAVVREVDMVARYGGEEFVVVLPESDSDGALGTAERICAAMRRDVFRVAGIDVPVTVSVGAAVFPRHGQNANDLIRAADRALYAAKAAGRDQWRLAADPEGEPA
jgi:diguanylate cyclase (GGDEF)-like protein